MDTLILKPCTLADIPALAQIGSLTFFETFEDTNTPQDMRQYLDTNFNTAQLSRELNHPHSHFFLAYCNGQVAGYLKLNEYPAQTEKNYPQSLELQRLYIARAFKHKHIGSLCMQTALEMARKLGLKSVWLGVWEHNEPAKKFYAKFGFHVIGAHTFVLGSDPQTDLLMQLIL